MTCIATDGKSIAADTQATSSNGIIQRRWSKLDLLPDGSVFASCGDSESGTVVRQWIAAGENPMARPQVSDDFEALRLMPDGTLLNYGPRCLPEAVPAPFAIGSGSHYAIGALEAGASPRRAVEIACIYDPFCKPPVDVITVVHKKGRRKKTP